MGGLMSDATAEYEKLVEALTNIPGVDIGQMFGKACIKIHGKAFLALHKDTVVFKVTGIIHKKALATPGAAQWDPSGKGRPMKEWIAIPAVERRAFKEFAKAALEYVAADI